MSVETRTAGCSGCGEAVEFEPLFFGGREILPTPVCEACADEWRREEEQERERRQFEGRLDRSKLPRTRWGIDLPEGPHGDAGRLWAEGSLPGLVLLGDVGVGKTHLAAAACWLHLRSAAVRWVSTARLMSQLRAGFADEARFDASAIMNGHGAIVLDDLDKAAPTEFGREVVFTTIDTRIEQGASLLVTTNLELGEISERYGEPVASRLAGYCRVVRMTGRDRRVES